MQMNPFQIGLERLIERKKAERKKPMRYPSIDELCRGKDGAEVLTVLRNCKANRQLNRYASNGYTPKKNRRFAAELPSSIFLNPRSIFRNFFNSQMSTEEKKKHWNKFLKMYPEFLVNDKR